jgi:predicted 2-oxoglutarate/Fe(II)-dependent dioxygenase YbiX
MNQPADPSASYVRLLAGDRRRNSTRIPAPVPTTPFTSWPVDICVLCFYGSPRNGRGRAAIDSVLSHRRLFDDLRASFLGVSTDPADESTVRVLDHSFKRRRDVEIEDAAPMRQLDARIARRICPEVLKVFSYKATRTERYTIGCYMAEEGGHFRPHRDNKAKGTAHRQFAISINLNSDFEGGALRFPEYGPRSFSPPAGGAVVFSCTLLHAVSPVTKGRRYAFIPFLYDDEAAKLREANNRYLGSGLDPFKPE